MTGRKGRIVSNNDGTISYQSRSKQDVPLELLNIAEKKRFMDGEKVFYISLIELFNINCYSGWYYWIILLESSAYSLKRVK